MQQNLKLILAYLIGQPMAPAELQRAIERLAANPEGLALFERLEASLSWPDDPAWLEELAAASEGVITPEVADFLANREALAQLAPELVARFEALLAAAPDEGADILPAFPSFAEQFQAQSEKPSPTSEMSSGVQADLETTSPQPSIWESVTMAGQQMRRLFTEIRVMVGQAGASFGQLPPPLSPQVVAAPLSRGKEKEPESKEQPQLSKMPSGVLTLSASEYDFSPTLIIGPVSKDKVTFSIQVNRVSSPQRLSRVRISLQNDKRQLLQSELTGEDGRVTFQDIKSGRYLIEVKYQGQVWELPLNFVLEQETADLDTG